MVPWHVGIEDQSRWSCVCEHCAERFGEPMPRELTPEVQAFREASVVDFLREVLAHVAERGGENTGASCRRPTGRMGSPIGTWLRRFPV